MRVFGMNYDTGFVYPGSTTHEPWDPETVRRDLRVIRDELHCDAVRLTGGIQDRLELAAQLAAEAGLEVWYCPFTNGLDRDELMAFVLDGAERAERLRRSGASVVYLTGSEISMFTNGFMPSGFIHPPGSRRPAWVPWLHFHLEEKSPWHPKFRVNHASGMVK